MSQLNYAQQANAFAGMMADLTQGYVKDTYVQGEASAEIAFGKFIVMKTGMTSGDPALGAGIPAIGVLPAASTDDFKGGGFVIHSHDYDKRLELGTTGLKPKTLMSVLRRGRIWVNAATAMAVTDLIYVHYAAGVTNAGAVAGDVANTSDAAKNTQLFGARVVTPIAAAGLCEIEVDMLAHAASSAAH